MATKDFSAQQLEQSDTFKTLFQDSAKQQIKAYEETLKEIERLEKESRNRRKEALQHDLEADADKELEVMKGLALSKEKLEAKFEADTAPIKKQALEKAEKYEKILYAKSAADRRKSELANTAEVLKIRKLEQEEALKLAQEAYDKQLKDYNANVSGMTAEEVAAAQALLGNLETKRNNAKKDLEVTNKDLGNTQKLQDSYLSRKEKREKKADDRKKKLDDQIAKAQNKREESQSKLLKAQERLDELKGKKNLTKEEKAEMEQLEKDVKQHEQDIKDADKEEKSARRKKASDEEESKVLEGASRALNGFVNGADDKINQAIADTYSGYTAISTRLQGFDKTYEKIMRTISENVGLSPVIVQTDVIKNLATVVDSGIAHNAELRAYLMTTADKIATTFDALSPTLLRLVRIQQQDSTAARLGLEASLTRLFNQYFSDTSYLSQAFDNVADAISEASSLLTMKASTEFEYIVQKWLGALSSVGMSDEAVNNIATAINYVGTGNVTELNSNSAMMTLIGMAASKASLPLADLLTNELTLDDTNKLLQGIIEYLQSIANNEEINKVTASAYAELLGISISDIRAVQNLTQKEIEALSLTQKTYDELIQETNTQLSQMRTRVHGSSYVENVIANATQSAAIGIASDSTLYTLWKANEIVKNVTGGGIPIPTIEILAMGSGGSLDLETTVNDLLSVVMAGGGLLSVLLGASGGIFDVENLSRWGDYDSSISRGEEIQSLLGGSKSGVSESGSMTSVGNKSSTDIQNSALSDATEDANKTAEITNKDLPSTEITMEQVYAALAESDTVNLLTEVQGINELLHRRFGSSSSSGSSLSDSDIGSTNTSSSNPNSSSADENAALTHLLEIVDILTTIEADINKVISMQPQSSTSDATNNTTDKITDLNAENKVNQSLASGSNNNTGKIGIKLDELSPNVRSEFEKLFKDATKEAVVSALSSGVDSDEPSLKDMIRHLMSDELNVRIVNNYIDTVLQELAYRN